MNRFCGFGHFLGPFRSSRGHGTGDAVMKVLVEQIYGDALQRLADGRDLREHIDAVLVFVDHSLKTSNLPLNASEAGEMVGLVVCVARCHASLFLTVVGYPPRVSPRSLTTRSVAMPNTTLTFEVPAMSCGHCVSAITTEVTQVPGVAGVAIDLETKAVVVTGDGLDDRAIRAAIEEAGFEAVE